MGHAGVAFTDVGGLEVASFPEVTGIADEQLFSESEMSKYCFEGIIGQCPAIRNVLEQVRLLRQRMRPSCCTVRRVQAKNWLHEPFTP